MIRSINNIEQTVIDFIHALQTRKSSDDIKDFYHPDVEQIEFPNALIKDKTIRNLQDLLDASTKGQKVLLKEEYEIVQTYAIENTVIAEVVWTGTLAIALGDMQPGGQIKAYFAQFYEFKDGKILRQRNYDCFEKFG